MKEQLIQKAKEIGFASQFFNNKPYKYSNKEDLRYYLWMCELKLWLEGEKIVIEKELYKIINDLLNK